MKNLNEQVCNITSQFYLETVSKAAAIAKIKNSCEVNGVAFLPDLIEFDGVMIHGGTELRFKINWSKIEKALKLNYDHNPSGFRLAYNCYDSATFKLDRKWYDQNLARCVKFFYTGGIEFLSSKTGTDHLHPDHYLSVACNLEPMSRAEQVENIYFK